MGLRKQVETAVPVAGMGIAVAPGLITVFFTHSPTAAMLRHRIPYIQKVIALNDDPFAVVVVVPADIIGELPDAESRAETKRQLQTFADRIGCVATVLEGNAIKLILVRAMLRSMSTGIRGPYRTGFFANVSDCEKWCLVQLRSRGVSRDTLPLQVAAEELRTLMKS